MRVFCEYGYCEKELSQVDFVRDICFFLRAKVLRAAFPGCWQKIDKITVTFDI